MTISPFNKELIEVLGDLPPGTLIQKLPNRWKVSNSSGDLEVFHEDIGEALKLYLCLCNHLPLEPQNPNVEPDKS